MKKLAIILMAAFLVMPLTASAVTLTFDEFPVGTVVTNQYAAQGVEFSGWTGAAPILANDGAMPTDPVLSPNPPYAGDFLIHFIGGATNVSFDSGYWDSLYTGVIAVYDPNAVFLGTVTNNSTAVYNFNFGALSIGWIVFDSSADPAGADIDNLTFDRVPEPASLLLLGSGMVGLWFAGRKRVK